jgi:hypothetical protein
MKNFFRFFSHARFHILKVRKFAGGKINGLFGFSVFGFVYGRFASLGYFFWQFNGCRKEVLLTKRTIMIICVIKFLCYLAWHELT